MPKGRGSNPNSIKNLVAGKNKKPGRKPTRLYLTEQIKEILALVGKGNMSNGVEILAQSYIEGCNTISKDIS